MNLENQLAQKNKNITNFNRKLESFKRITEKISKIKMEIGFICSNVSTNVSILKTKNQILFTKQNASNFSKAEKFVLELDKNYHEISRLKTQLQIFKQNKTSSFKKLGIQCLRKKIFDLHSLFAVQLVSVKKTLERVRASHALLKAKIIKCDNLICSNNSLKKELDAFKSLKAQNDEEKMEMSLRLTELSFENKQLKKEILDLRVADMPNIQKLYAENRSLKALNKKLSQEAIEQRLRAENIYKSQRPQKYEKVIDQLERENVELTQINQNIILSINPAPALHDPLPHPARLHNPTARQLFASQSEPDHSHLQGERSGIGTAKENKSPFYQSQLSRNKLV